MFCIDIYPFSQIPARKRLTSEFILIPKGEEKGIKLFFLEPIVSFLIESDAFCQLNGPENWQNAKQNGRKLGRKAEMINIYFHFVHSLHSHIHR